MSTFKNEFLTWDQTRREIKSLNDVEKKAISGMAKIVNQLMLRRKVLGLTQQEVATKAGITQAQVARVENEHTIPKLDTILKIASALDVSIELIANGESHS
ncbi:helix-turn-helix transcriptional regulator [Saccharibacillus sacchari]|uniref:Helix-turn-helix domain-containing protein n=1 Tax=Saccharibacillus sacchari TaxID=456493 RepID=A0ACC6PI37_9BACL